MNSPDNTVAKAETMQKGASAVTVLVREAGVPFQARSSSDCGFEPFAEWLSLMEVVQMLCPTWPVRDRPMQGQHWRL